MSQGNADAISAVLLKAISKSLGNARELITIKTLQSVLNRLAELPLGDISVSADKITTNMEKISRSMVKDLQRIFGSADKLLKAAMTADDPFFDHAVEMILKIMACPDCMKSAAASSFSAVGKYFLKPFKMCR